jgi:hypothetical protein
MAHYAFLDDNNIVTEVIVGTDETELIEGKDPEAWYSEFKGQTCKRTSYNSKIRKNYASVGFTYDSERDAFIAPKPFDSWKLDEETCRWFAPVAYQEQLPKTAHTYGHITQQSRPASARPPHGGPQPPHAIPPRVPHRPQQNRENNPIYK